MQKRAGFSVVELLVVIALMGTIVVVAAGINYNSRHRWSMQDLARDITSSYYQLKQYAARENIPCRMRFTAVGFSMYRSIVPDPANPLVRAWDTDHPLREIELGPETSLYLVAGTPDLAIDARGYIYKTDDACSLTMEGVKTVEIRAPHRKGGNFGDQTVITFYPFGGIDVHKTLSQVLP